MNVGAPGPCAHGKRSEPKLAICLHCAISGGRRIDAGAALSPSGACDILHEPGGKAQLPQQYYPVLLTLGVALVVGTSLLLLSQLLGKLGGNQVGGRIKRTTYESGMPLLDRSHKRMSIAFFLVAIDFIVFDLEAAFLYPWALILKRGGWELFAAVMVFVFLILVGYAYIWLKGGLDVGPQRDQPRRFRRPSALTAGRGPSASRPLEAQL
jgi:NADH-quinone oxidoreductase subunit A